MLSMDLPALEVGTHPCGPEGSALCVSLLVSTSSNVGCRFREWGCVVGHQHGLLLAAIEDFAGNHWFIFWSVMAGKAPPQFDAQICSLLGESH